MSWKLLWKLLWKWAGPESAIFTEELFDCRLQCTHEALYQIPVTPCFYQQSEAMVRYNVLVVNYTSHTLHGYCWPKNSK